jgi:hypothetical protein
MLELDGAWFVQGCFGERGWVANLRAAGEGDRHGAGRPSRTGPGHRAVARGGRSRTAALAGFRRSRFFRALYGPNARGPVGVMWAFRIRMNDTLEEYTAAARRYPLFELRPIHEAST